MSAPQPDILESIEQALERSRRQQGLILWEGPSSVDGKPVVVVATFGSRNRKTGSMVQTWILRADIEPQIAIRSGDDASICGTCPHRFNPETNARTCYVNVNNAPLAVFRRYQRNGYQKATAADLAWLKQQAVRAGSYGDPGSVPSHVWDDVLGRVHTGYTHQWRTSPNLRRHLMASVDSLAERDEARAQGWRTFRVAAHDEPKLATSVEVECRSETDGVSCADCKLCDGSRRAATETPATSIAIRAHGPSKRLFILQ